MSAREGPEPDLAERSRAVALGSLARGLGLLLGPLLLCVVLPLATCRLVCVPYRELCEDAGGDYSETFAHGHECDMDQPVDAAHPCPDAFVHRPGSLTNCDGEDVWPLATVSPLWH